MTYYALAVTTCLAALLISFAAAAAACALIEWLVSRWHRLSPETRSRAVFICRVAPLVLSLGTTFFVVLPSFLQWEPQSTTETIGWRLAWLSGLTLALLTFLCVRILRVVIAGNRLAKLWMRDASRIGGANGVPVYQLPGAGSLVATVGIATAKIFVSSDVVESLSPAELDAALAHERAHVRSGDNLKQLLVRALRLPWASGDRVWTSGTEIEADLNAFRAGASPVELASALVKVARLRSVVRLDPRLATCLIPAGHETALADRVRRLNDLLDAEPVPPPRRHWRVAVPCSIAVALTVTAAVTQPTVLRLTHQLIERLV